MRIDVRDQQTRTKSQAFSQLCYYFSRRFSRFFCLPALYVIATFLSSWLAQAADNAFHGALAMDQQLAQLEKLLPSYDVTKPPPFIDPAIWVALACDSSQPPASSQKAPQSQTAAQSSSSKGSTEVTLCDGETTTTVPANMERTRENGVAISDVLMAQWKRKHRTWIG